ncbi:uncharacterized protein LOC135502514 [Lineus longissimus]|uniref:uncharacterized protein LOC135502514 n=1 Tax=Lineus longissimus TaxID=88925 RepID=UPI002B4F3DA0
MELHHTSLGVLILAFAVPSSSVLLNDICANISESLMTPFNIGFPGYPNTASFSAGQSCHCHMSIQERKSFSFSAKNFSTSTKDVLAVKWNRGLRTKVVSEAGKNANITLEHLRDLTLSFTPAKAGSGTMLLGVIGDQKEQINLKCQDTPFDLKNACSNISMILETPFSLNNPGYPESFSFSAGESCHCRMFTVESYGFSVIVKKFETERRDVLALNWYDWNNSTGRKNITSEEAQDVTDLTTNLKDLTLSFRSVKGGSGEFLIEVESERMDVWNESKIQVTMRLDCQDHPFQLKTGYEKKRLHYILYNAIPIGLMAVIGIIVIASLLFVLCFGKVEKTGPHYKLGEVDPTIKIREPLVQSTSDVGYHQGEGASHENKSYVASRL